jgi:hypothetical protein
MDFWSILRRRWILAGSLLLLTLIATAYGLVKLPTSYQSISSVVLLAPKNTAKVYGGNPYLAFSATLNETADVVRYETNDSRTVALLVSRGYTASYLVTDATDTAGPVLIVTVTGKNKAMVEHTLSGVTAEISTKLEALQADITPGNKIHSLLITFNQPTPLTSKKARPLSVVAGGGIALTIGVTLIVDAMAVRRRRTDKVPPLRDDAMPPRRRDEAMPPKRSARISERTARDASGAKADRWGPMPEADDIRTGSDRSARLDHADDIRTGSDRSARLDNAPGADQRAKPTARRP